MVFPDIVTSKIEADQKTKGGIGVEAKVPEIEFPPTPKNSDNGETDQTHDTTASDSAPAPAPAQESEIEIELGDKKEEVAGKKKMSLKGSDFFDRDIDKKTSDASAKTDRPTQKSAANRAITEEPITDKKLVPDVDDYDFFAGLLVEGFDLGTSTAFRWWAMDTSDAPYEMTKKKKDKLTVIVGEGLRRMKKKYPLIAIFLFTLAIALYTPGRKAYDMRKVKKKEIAARVKTKPPPKNDEKPKGKTKAKEDTKPKGDSKTKSGVRRPGGVAK